MCCHVTMNNAFAVELRRIWMAQAAHEDVLGNIDRSRRNLSERSDQEPT